MRDFNHTINVLVKAYLNNTLVHGNCYACAVGNLIAEANGYNFVKCLDRPSKKITWDVIGGLYTQTGNFGAWYDHISTCRLDKNEYGLTEIHSTGYSLKEVIKIEGAFESCPEGNSDDEYMFNGLMAVVDVLADIHGIDLKEKEEAKLLFVK